MLQIKNLSKSYGAKKAVSNLSSVSYTHLYDRLQAAGRTVDKANYMEVYAAPLTAGTTLEDIYRTFNVDYPADFKGHSLSVSDVVVLHQNGQDTAHYCDCLLYTSANSLSPPRTASIWRWFCRKA